MPVSAGEESSRFDFGVSKETRFVPVATPADTTLTHENVEMRVTLYSDRVRNGAWIFQLSEHFPERDSAVRDSGAAIVCSRYPPGTRDDIELPAR